MYQFCLTITKLINFKKHCFYLLLLLLQFLYSKHAYSQTDSINIYDLSLAQLSKLKISTPSKTVLDISEISSTIIVITAAQIKENGYFTLEEVLSDLPGFQFRNILGINSYIFQRGIPNQNNLTLLLIDGVQINELNSGGFYAGGLYNLSNIERIEVIYGPSSVAYGTNAVSGIINLITKTAMEKRIELSTLAGSFNTIKSDFNFCNINKKKTLEVSFAGMIKKTDKANLKGQEGDNNWTDLMDNFENDYSFDLKIQSKNVVFGTNYLYKEASLATFRKSVGTSYRDYGTSWNIQFINNYLKFKKKISEKLTYTSVLYNRNTTVLNSTIYAIVDTVQIACYRPNNLSGIENIINYDLKHFFSFTGGVTIEYEQLSKDFTYSFSNSPELKPVKPQKPIQLNNYLTSIFIEPRFTLLKNLYLSGGIRFDKSSNYDKVLTPGAGISYHFREQILRFSYSEAFRAPKPWDYNDGLGNPSLLPEKMKSLEAAIAFSISTNFKIDLIGFKNILQNAITKNITTEGYNWVNNGEVNTDGMEIYLKYNSYKLKPSINYTYNQSYNELGVFIPEISKHSGNASITYSIKEHIKINIRANYIGKRENPKLIISTNSKFVEPCLIFHGALSFLDYKGFSAQLIAKNILNKKYYHTSNREPDRYRQAQRTIMLSFNYSL